jgi:transcriptional regulator with XRE-family HTH domain
MAKKPDPIDAHVGARLRERRIIQGLSQEKLGETLGVTFQQIQKYEKGVNRIGPSRLQLAARLFGVPVNYFFEGSASVSASTSGFLDDPGSEYIARNVDSQAERLARAFARIEDDDVRRRLVDLVEAMVTNLKP